MWWYILGATVLIFLIYFIWGNVTIKIKYLKVESKGLPPAFSGLKIAHVSDVHNTKKWGKTEKILSALKEERVDAIFLTGDLIDSRLTDEKVGLAFAENLQKIAQVYFVLGNHEARLKDLDKIIQKLKSFGVIVLINSSVEIEKQGDKITILGVADPVLHAKYRSGEEKAEMQKALLKTVKGVNGYTVLLSHRPEHFDLYESKGINLIFAGHAHGGQIQLPFIGGVYAPAQGIFPKFDKGIFEKNNTKMILSGGVGNGFFATRIFNRPEVLIIELK